LNEFGDSNNPFVVASGGANNGGGAPSLAKKSELPSRGFEKFNVTFGDIATNIKETLNDSILSCTVDYSIDQVTEITLRIIDRDYVKSKGSRSFASGNYFNNRKGRHLPDQDHSRGHLVQRGRQGCQP